MSAWVIVDKGGLPPRDVNVLCSINDGISYFVGYYTGDNDNYEPIWMQDTEYVDCNIHCNVVLGKIDRWMYIPIND